MYILLYIYICLYVYIYIQGDWVYPYRPGDYATLTRKYLGSLYWSTLTLTTIGDLPTPETNAEYDNFCFFILLKLLNLYYNVV